ncbi:hypothetical protein N7540_000246 [Penicillium herquei]|nr:hypothetical protein N7540_000246 [Penicillium herquei]
MNQGESWKCPYVDGNVIKLHLEAGPDKKTATTNATVIRVFEPFTLSSVMMVRISCPDLALNGDMVLKVFDRRFAIQLRKDEKIQPWTADVEKDYHHFVHDGRAEEFIAALNSDGDIARPEEPWNKLQEEAYLHDHLLDLYKTEVKVYNLLRDLQGKEIPDLFSTVLIPGFDPDVLEPVTGGFPGIILKHIEGFPLTNIADHAPKETWQSICDDAIRILHLMGDRGILNEDVKTRSFIVNLDSEQPKQFKMTMIDLALCKFREEYKDEQEWSESKAIQEEEEAIGLIMRDKLNGGFVYHRSERYKKPASYYE